MKKKRKETKKSQKEKQKMQKKLPSLNASHSGKVA
jgi:hypothetical protein